ncbi:helix-turn-helix domain-containing protein [Kitasatospora fiedleri]|uniref:helix-turn-helix domain-containing protein n=1 Tax=Kitasatospora fiedleri TaxID=2991545 RepID=UPI00249C5D90|nr:helix-turn-helix transcriptional regulator [Kitasatospora fiedleri]
MITHIVGHVRARGQDIRRKREQMGYGLRRFASQVAISPAHLSRIERGQRGAQPEVIKRIADKLQVTMLDIADPLE